MNDILDAFLNYEKKYKLNENIPQWTYIRSLYAFVITRNNYLKKTSQRNEIKKKQIIERNSNLIIKKIKTLIKLFKLIVKYISLLIVIPFVKLNGEMKLFIPFYRKSEKYPCKFTYKYYEIFKNKSIVFDIDRKFFDMIKSKNHAIFYKYLIKVDLVTIKGKKKEIALNLNKVIDYLEKFESENDLSFMNDDYLRSSIEKNIRNYNRNFQKFRNINKILSKTNISQIYEVSCTRCINQIINFYTNKSNIKTIEVEHGQIGDNHIAYKFYEKKIPTYSKYFFSFGDYYKKNLNLAIPNSNIISTGYIYYNDRKKELRLEKNEYILFLSQGTVGKSLSKYASYLSKNIPDEKIVYKLHPKEYLTWKSDYPDLLNSEVIVIDDDDYDLYHYIESAKIQIGVFSTALIEGYGCDLPTILVDVENYINDYISNLLGRPNVAVVNDFDSTKEKFYELTQRKNVNNRYNDLWIDLADEDLYSIIDNL